MDPLISTTGWPVCRDSDPQTRGIRRPPAGQSVGTQTHRPEAYGDRRLANIWGLRVHGWKTGRFLVPFRPGGSEKQNAETLNFDL